MLEVEMARVRNGLITTETIDEVSIMEDDEIPVLDDNDKNDRESPNLLGITSNKEMR